jgi:hypothetical protein
MMRIFFALLVIIIPCTVVWSQSPWPHAVKIFESKILSDIAELKKHQPDITTKELVAYGNELLETRGFDYEFSLCDLLSARDKKSTVPSFSRRYQASLTDGGKLMLDLDISNPQDGFCGECWSHIPSRQVTSREMHVIAKGKSYRIRRTESFYLDQVQLVDSSLKKVLRTWVVPFQTIPTGVSADGTKLYLQHWSQETLEDLVLELSEDGRLIFRDRADLDLKEGTSIDDFPRDPKNNYLSYMKFQVGNKSHIVRFTAPCT